MTLFREAQGYLEWLRDSLAPPARPAVFAPPGAALAGEIRQVGVLLDQAARFGRRWLEACGAISPEYTASGHPPASHRRAHLFHRINTMSSLSATLLGASSALDAFQYA